MNFFPFPGCAKGIAKCFTPSVDELPVVSKGSNASLFDSSTADTLPDYPFGGDFDSDDGEEIASRILEDITIETWEPEQFEMVKTLQNAPANKGCVDLMKTLEYGGRFVAVKRMPTSWATISQTEFARTHPDAHERPWVDIGITNYLHERRFVNICEPLGIYGDGIETYVVNSFANRGELFALLDCDPKSGPEREEMLRPIMKQLFAAVRQLHDLGIAHRDISLENVLLHDDGDGMTVKLIDFGLATTERHAYERSGKKSYIAPEMRQEVPYDTFLSDVFALGVTLFSLACREYPWNSTAPGGCKLYSYVAQHGLRQFMERRKVYGSSEKIAEVISKPLAELLTGLLQFDPAKRCSLGEKCWADEEAVSRPSIWDVAWFKMQD
jgi:serine/threonine protein kinase